jgi:hypothetical protein
MDAIEALAPADASECRLVTSALSSANRSFYAHRGYAETGAKVHESGVAVIEMTKPLR